MLILCFHGCTTFACPNENDHRGRGATSPRAIQPTEFFGASPCSSPRSVSAARDSRGFGFSREHKSETNGVAAQTKPKKNPIPISNPIPRGKVKNGIVSQRMLRIAAPHTTNHGILNAFENRTGCMILAPIQNVTTSHIGVPAGVVKYPFNPVTEIDLSPLIDFSSSPTLIV